jgi:hypothetical protein
MRKPIAIAIAIAIAATLAVLAPTAAPAQEELQLISSITILDAVLDMDTHEATVTVSVTCLMDVPYFVGGGYARLTQRARSGRVASSLRSGFGTGGCLAGQVLVFPLRFSRQQGTFLPGAADLRVVVVATLACPPCLDDDTEDIATTVTLRPV